MARTVQDANLSTRAARLRLASGSPYWRMLDRSVHLGYRRGSLGGRWLVRYYCGDRRYKQEVLGTADDILDADGFNVLNFPQAQAKAREAFMQRTANPESPDVAKLTVSGALQAYFHEQERLGRKTFREARIRAAALIEPTFGERAIVDIKTEEIKAWLEDLVKRPPRRRRKKNATAPNQRSEKTDPQFLRRRQATVNRTLTIFKAALNQAWRDGKVESDVAWRRVQPYRETTGVRTRFLTVEEAQRLLQACTDELRTLVSAALVTGARYGELASANVGDFDRIAGTLFIPESKSGKSRHVVLTDEGIALFTGLSQDRKAGSPLIARASGDRWGRNLYYRDFSAAVATANLGDITFHGLRHTYASLSIMNNCPLIVVATNLGHADTRMCEKHYGHLANSYIRETVRNTAPTFGLANVAWQSTAA